MSNPIPNSLRIFILLATTALFATTSKAAVLYDQTAGFVGNSAASQEFDPAGPNDSATCAGADDFVVPVGGWTIRSIDVNGTIFNDPAPVGFQLVSNVDVIIYADASGSPGAAVATYTDIVPAFQDTTGNFTVNLPCGVNLAQGTYWLSVVVDEDFATFGQWGWGTLPGIPVGNFAHWQNPLNGFATGCTGWSVRTSCGAIGSDPDNSFALHDSVQGCIDIFPYQQDFEACAGHWMSGGTAPTWSLGTPNGSVISGPAAPGTNSWWTNNGGGATPLPIGEQSFVMSPCFDLSSLQNPEIVLDINNDPANNALNGAVLQYSLNGGATWQNVGSGTSSTTTTLGPSANWFDAAGLPVGAGGQNVAHWTSINTSGWATAHHLLTDPTGTVSLGGQSNVILRIAFATNTVPFGQGFGFDNIIIREGPTTEMAINSISAPVSACGLSNSETVTVELENLGTVPNSSYSVTFDITGPNSATVTESAVPSIPAFSTQNFTFAATFDASLPGTYNGVAYVSAPGDSDPLNDTITFSFSNDPIPPGLSGTTNDTICGLDTICLTASGAPDSAILWYDSPTAMTAIACGDTFCVVNPSATDTFYAAVTTYGTANPLVTVDTVLSTIDGAGTATLSIPVPNNGCVGGARITSLRVTGDLGAGTTEVVDFSIDGVPLLTGFKNTPAVDCGPLTPTTPTLAVPFDISGIIAGKNSIDLELTQASGVNDFCALGSITGLGSALEVTIEWETPLCQSPRMMAIAVVETADPISIASDTSICGVPGPVSFTANSAGSYTYTWDGSAGSGVAAPFVGNPLVTTPTASSQVFVEGVDGNGCVSRDTANITVASNPPLTASINPLLGCPGDTFTLSVPSGGNPSYCTTGVGPSNTFDSNVESVVLNGESSNINFLTGCPGVAGVSDQTALVADVINGSSYTATIDFGTCGGNFFGVGEAWIDWNQNGTFEPGESIGTQGSSNPPGLASFNFTVPAGAAPGNTRMRVMHQEGGSLPLNPCGSFTWGSVHDFTIQVAAPFTYNWTSNPPGLMAMGDTVLVTPNDTTDYYLVVTDTLAGCQSFDTFTAIVPALPPAPTGAEDSSRCGAGSVTLTAVANGPGVLDWFDLSGNLIGAGNTISTPVITDTTDFLVAERNVFGCNGPFDTVTAIVNSADSILVTTSDTLVCGSGTTITLTATQQGSLSYSYNFNWSSTAGGGLNSTLGTIVTADPTQSATYTVVGQDLGGSGCQAIETVDVSFGISPAYTAVADPDTICEGDTTQLLVQGAEFSVVSVDTILVNVSNGTASITFNVPNGGDILSASVDLRITGDLGSTTEIGDFNIDASSVATGIRYNGGGDCNPMSAAFFGGTGNPVGTVDVTSLLQGNSTVTYELDFSGSPTSVDNFCTFNSIGGLAGVLEVTTTVNIRQSWSASWSPTASLDDPNSFEPLAFPTTSTSYLVTVTDSASGCFTDDTADVTVIPAPATPVALDTNRCGSGTVVLEATTTGTLDSLRWYDMAGNLLGTGSPLTSPIIFDTTDFQVREIDGSCPGPFDTMTAVVIPADTIVLSPTDTTVCGPLTPVTFTATQVGSLAYTYNLNWSIGLVDTSTTVVTESVQISNSTPGGTVTQAYTVPNNGNIISATLNIELSGDFGLTTENADISIDGTPVATAVTPPGTADCQPLAPITGPSNIDVTALLQGNPTVNLEFFISTAVNVCTPFGLANLIFDIEYATGDTVYVNPTSGATTTAYAANDAIVTVTGTDPGASGCADVASATITVLDLPFATASVDEDTVCSGDTVNLSASVAPSPFAYNVEEIAFDTFANAGSPVTLGFNQSSIVPIGFNFEFYGNTYNFGYITSNGLFGFDPTNVTSNASTAIANPATPNNFIAGLWEYLRPDNATTTPSVRYQTVGAAPNRVFVITYSDVPFGFNTGNTWFQIQLYEGTNVIEVHTKEVTTAGVQASVVGIENATGTEGTFVSGRNNQDFDVVTPDAYRFSPPTPYSFGWMPMAGVLNPDTLATQAVVSTSTSYVFMATDSGTGCTGYDTVDVYMNPVLPAPFGLDVDACGSQSVTLSALPSFAPPSPQNNQDSIFYYILPSDSLLGTGISVTTPILADTTQFRIVERINGCEGNDLIVSANIDQADTIAILPSDTFICDTSANVSLTASSLAPYNYTWTGPDIVSGANSATVVVSPNTTTTYQVTGIDPTPPNCQDVAFVTVTVGAPPVIDAIPDADSICQGDTVQLDVNLISSGALVTDTQTVNQTLFDFLMPGTETTVFNVPNNGNILSASVNISQRGDLDGGGTSESATFSIDGSIIANQVSTPGFCPAGFTQGVTNVDVTALLQGNPTVDLESFVTASADGCDADFIWDISVTYATGVGYTWSPMAGLSDPNIADPLAYPAASTQYVVSAIDSASQCIGYDTVDITVTPTPAAPVAYDSARCGFGTLNLAAMAVSNNDSLRWYDLAGVQLGSGTPIVSPAIGTTTQFQVAEWTNGCEGEYDTMTATVIVADSIAIVASDTAVCGSGTTVSFTATQIGGSPYSYVYTWTGTGLIDSTGASASATVNAPGTYTVVGTDTTGTGCANTNSILIDQNPFPVIQTVDADTICQGDTAQLAVSGASAIPVSTFTVNQTLFDFLMPGTETTVFNVPNNGNILSASVNISQRGDLDGGGTFESATFSIDGSIIANQISTPGFCPAGFTQGVTNVDVTALLQGNPTVNLESFVTASADGCDADFIWELTITTASNVRYAWTPNMMISDTTIRDPQAWPMMTTPYIVTVTDTLTGCTAVDTTVVEVIPTPAAPVAMDTNRCGTGTVDLIATTTGDVDSLRWFDIAGNYLGNGSPLTSPFLTSNSQFVVQEFDFGCSGPTDTTDVTIIPAATISVSSSDTQVCGAGQTITLTATQSPAAYTYNYMWSASAGGALNATMGNPVTATPASAGTYTYVANGTDAGSGCANTDTVEVVVEDIPTVTATSTPDSVCSGDPVSLSGTVVPAPGTYSVTSIAFDTLSGVGTNVNLPFDDASQVVPIGFNFDFFGNTYTQLWVSSNGFLTFTNSFTTAANGAAVPNAFSANNLIALAWEDLDIPAQGGTVDYYTTGSAPNRVFVVNFREVGFDFSTTSKVSIQAQLHEATGNIEIHNVNVNVPASFQTSVQGIENATGTVGFAVPGRNNTNWSATNDAWLFAPVGPQTYQWTGQAIASPTQLNTTANPTSSGDYILNVTTASGCTASDTVPVNINPLPFNLTPNNLQTTATDFRWNSGNPGSPYTVYWGTVGFIPSGPGQLGSTNGTSIGGVNTTGTATVNTSATLNNSVSNSTVNQIFNVPAGGNITSATLNIQMAGDFGSTFETGNITIDGNPVATGIRPNTGDCSPLAPAGPANIDVTALLQGNATVNLGFFINNDVNICAPFGQAVFNFTIDTVVAGPTTATGLLPNTTYQFYVEEDCGITGPINFTTPIGCFWLGNNSNWNDPANWSAACGGVPRGCGAPDVTVGPTSNDPIVTADDSLNNIDILAGASVTIDPTINLFVCGDWTNNGTFSHGDGRVVMDGDTSQTIFGASDFGFLEIDNQTGNDVSLDPGADVGVQNGLLMTEGDLDVPGGASLTILSNSTGTGYVDDFSSPSAGSISGNITMQRLVRNTGAGRAFYFISSAVGGTNVVDWSDDFDTRGRLSGIANGNNLNGRQVIPTAACLVDSLDPRSPYGGLFNYIESAVTGCTLEGWHIKSSGAISAGEGYAGIIPDGVVVDVTGPANTGTITKAITRTVTNTATPGFVLVGNPFPSAIDWAQVVTENGTAINGTAYMWQSTGYYSGVSLPLNVMVSGEIGSSQGFEVEALKDTVLTFTQTQRTTGDPAFVRSAPLWDQRIDLIVEGNNFADVTRIIFSDVSTDGFDGWYDSYKHEVNSFQPSIWSMLSNDDMGINSFGEFDGSEVVDVRMKPGTNGSYTIKAEFLETFDATTLAFLEDKQTGTIHCLTFNPQYTFTSNVNDAADRFLVYFTPPAEITTVDASCSGFDGSITVDLGVFNHAGSAFQWDTYQVVDDNNVVVASGSNVNGVINVPSVTAGNYTLELEYQGNVVSKPIVVDGDQAVLAAFATAGTSHFEGDPIDFVNSSTGANDYTWDFGDGTILTGVVNPSYAYAAAGTYLVKLISVNDDGCQDIKTETVEVQSKTSTGIDLADEDMLNVYGADNTIFVDVIDVTEPETDVEVYDMNGKLILSKTFEGENMHTIPMDEASGYYIVRASNGDVTVSRKVLIIE